MVTEDKMGIFVLSTILLIKEIPTFHNHAEKWFYSFCACKMPQQMNAHFLTCWWSRINFFACHMVAEWEWRQRLGKVRSLWGCTQCCCHSSVNILALVEAPSTSWRLRSCNESCRNPWECVSKSVYLLSLLFFPLNNKIFTGSNATWFTIGINWRGCFKDFLSVDHGHWKMPEFRVLKY